MTPCETLSAADILAILPDEPERLFSGDPDAMRGEFIALVKRWHPDRNAGSATAALVFDRVTTLHRAAQRKLAEGRWAAPDSIRIESAAGGSFLLPVRRRHAFELGEFAIASDRVVFLVDGEHKALFEAGLRRIAGIRYPDARIRRDIAPFMPEIEGLHAAGDRHVAIIAKPDDVVLLADLLRHTGGALPPRHVAWIVSSLLNLVCFFAVSGLTHNALATDTVFVTPQHHAAYPLGGWWYAARAGDPISALPEASFALLPRSTAAAKRADIRLDLECVRAIGRACLGDPTGLTLPARADLPRPMADFLRLPSSGSAIDDYRDWGATLDDSFGPRRFVELPISFSDVYP